ncbi:glycosyltransferase [Aliivibrio fischeri ES114]|uniref:Glycosyltransferase n=1 Tax=Aliivibrio fischeri (strain ATCC 700601 / ES114) TaxID=312309 RepID=Q5E8K2_ALIF1|nr:glycosyltransferase family 4 protein [Aliivibrio fischeri]AAW84644.1 glycosyltransferase [Aliivibrio fischeri ES114]
MKIALVMVHGRVHGHVGGAPRVFFDMANHLSFEGHEVLAVYNDSKEGSPYYEVTNKVNLKNLALPIKFKGLWLYKAFREVIRSFAKLFNTDLRLNPVTKKNQKRVGLALKSLIDDFKPDVTISYNVSDLVSLSYIEWKARNSIVMCHTDPKRVYKGLANYERSIWQGADFIQVLLASYKDYLSKVINTNIEVIGNVVIEHDEVNDLSAFRIIYLARIEKNKQQHLLIEAINKIPLNVRLGWQVVLYGSCNDTEYSEFLINKINSYNLSDVIKLKGPTGKPFEELLNSSICAFPSAFEGFPLALTEAMSLGLPCIGFQSCSGVNELLINNYNGFLVKGVEEFALQLEVLMKSKERRSLMGSKARDSIECYSKESIYKKWKALIENKNVIV